MGRKGVVPFFLRAVEYGNKLGSPLTALVRSFQVSALLFFFSFLFGPEFAQAGQSSVRFFFSFGFCARIPSLFRVKEEDAFFSFSPSDSLFPDDRQCLRPSLFPHMDSSYWLGAVSFFSSGQWKDPFPVLLFFLQRCIAVRRMSAALPPIAGDEKTPSEQDHVSSPFPNDTHKIDSLPFFPFPHEDHVQRDLLFKTIPPFFFFSC